MMTPYSNLYNSYRYGSNQSQQQNTSNNFAGNRQSTQPPQGYVEANYGWENQDGAARAYSNDNDAFSRSQETSSSFTHLPAALGSYHHAMRTDENTQNNTGLNHLVYASALESSIKDPGTSQTKTTRQGSMGPSQYHNTATSYDYASQNSASKPAANSQTGNYNQELQQSTHTAPQTVAPSYAPSYSFSSPTINDTSRQYYTQPTHVSQPEPQPSLRANSHIQQSRKIAQYNSPPVTNSPANITSNAPTYSQTSLGYKPFTIDAASAANHKRSTNSRKPPATDSSSIGNAPAMAQNQPAVSSENSINVTISSDAKPRNTEQSTSSKVQYINPSELYTQQYFVAQERARVAEAEAAAAEQSRKQENEAQAEAMARAAEAASATANALMTPTGAGKEKSTKAKPTKNSARKRSSAKKKASDKEPQTANVPQPDEDSMALEMRAMLEKLRGMRTKDPSLFAQLWDDFKKAPAGNQETPTPQQAAVISNQYVVGQLPALVTSASKNESEGVSLPDLGKFPAQRRRRKTKDDVPKIANSQVDASTTLAQANVNTPLNQDQSTPTSFHDQRDISVPTSSTTISRIVPESLNATKTTKSRTPVEQDATWPAATQQKLAQAASEYLSKDPANKGKCSPESLMLLLKNNPTYPDLCVQLESRGFLLDRQAMARSLLAAVPALVSGNNVQEQKKAEAKKDSPPSRKIESQSSVTTQPFSTQPVQPTELVPQPQVAFSSQPLLGNTQSETSATQYRFVQENALDPITAINSSVPQPNQKKEKQKSLPRPRRSDGAFATVTPLGPKAEMARKRLFSEIVDMSQLSSDDDGVFSDDGDDEDEDSHGLAENSRLNPTVNGQSNLAEVGLDIMDIDTDSPPTEHSLSNSRAIQEASNPHAEIEFDPDDKRILESIKRLPNITKPLDPSAALKRVYYNPKTIARDIMLATGRHPSERPLNYHLMNFTQIFLGVTARSDLETFRWDLVDPGGPPMPAVELEDVLVEPPQITRKKRRRDQIQSRDVTEAKGPTSASQPSQTVNAPEQASISISTPQGPRSTMAGTPTTGQRTGRRGRPPGAKNKKPTKASLKAAVVSTRDASSMKNGQNPMPASARTVPEPSYPVFTCEWASCPAQLHDVHTLERHVAKIHVPGQTTCQWVDCLNSTTEYSGSGDLQEHLAQAHIQPLAWKYGDGPSVNGPDFELGRYLNVNGYIVTPDATTAGENDALIFPVEQTPIRAFNKLYGDHKPTQRAQQVLRAIQKRRKRVGIGLEQEGCEFSTPTRNKQFVNDEEHYEVVPNEEDGTDDWYSQGDAS